MIDYVTHEELMEALSLLVGLANLFAVIYFQRSNRDHHKDDR